jgi:mannose-1-phosphate guanylyltransferase
MAGGTGTRFWPRSRGRTPKQLLPVLGTRSMLQETVARVRPVVGRDRILVVTARDQAAAVRAQLRARGDTILREPLPRNTAAAVALAALTVARRDPRAVLAVVPSDHAIGDLAAFRADLRLACDVAERLSALVTLGIEPTRPETGYGYLQVGDGLPGARGRVAWVRRFVEKPARARAEALLRAGRVLWNTGIFAWRVDVILAALRRHLPAVLGPMEAAGRSPRALGAAYAGLPSVSIDTGVLERAERLAVVRGRFRWSDVGSWAALEPLAGSPPNGRNVIRGRALPIDSRGCVVDSPQRLVALLGVEDLVVVDSPDALLVCRKDRAQDVRRVVDELRRRGLGRYL